VEEWLFNAENLNGEELLRLGKLMDQREVTLNGRSAFMEVAEQLLRVRTRSGLVRPLLANDVQKEFERNCGQRNIVLKARQLGLTTWAAARFFLRTITHPGTLTLQVAHTQDSAEEIFRIVHRFVDYLPNHLRRGCLRTSRANVRQLVFPEFDSGYTVVSAGERNAGRGLTVQNLHCSELARWPGDPAETLAGLRAALAPNGEQILESTPDGIGGCFYDEWQSASESGMVRHFFPWWMEVDYRAKAVPEESLSEEERELMARHGLTLAQVGFRRGVRSNFRGLARQEYAEDAESCFRVSGDSIFELKLVEERLLSAPEAGETRHNGALEIWLPPVAGKQYIVAVDPAGGGSEGDYSAAEVLDMETGMQCAEFAGHVGGLELAEFLAKLGEEYNHAWIVVERNNHGYGVLWMLQSVCHYTRIYQEKEEMGWYTTSANRPVVIGQLSAFLAAEVDRIMSQRLLAECRSFVRLPNGCTGARAGTHDDRVMAMAIGLAARAEMLQTGTARI
jgi:hypothetical protein